MTSFTPSSAPLHYIFAPCISLPAGNGAVSVGTVASGRRPTKIASTISGASSSVTVP